MQYKLLCFFFLFFSLTACADKVLSLNSPIQEQGTISASVWYTKIDKNKARNKGKIIELPLLAQAQWKNSNADVALVLVHGALFAQCSYEQKLNCEIHSPFPYAESIALETSYLLLENISRIQHGKTFQEEFQQEYIHNAEESIVKFIITSFEEE